MDRVIAQNLHRAAAAASIHTYSLATKTMSSNRRSALDDSDEEDEPTSTQSRKRTALADSDDEEMHEGEESPTPQVAFSSQYPEMSQAIIPPKPSEQTKLLDLTEEKREKAIMDLSRAVLFKALAHEAFDRAKCAKDAGVDSRLSNATYEQVQLRLQNTFGFEMLKIPAFMENMKGLPEKYKNRYYVVNPLPDQHGDNHKRLHSVHPDCAKEKGLLMVVLALA